jgi:hypothetical protein
VIYENVLMCLNNCILLQNLPNLEILDLSMSGSPNLKYVRLNGCLSLPEVDSSIFFLQKLESLINYNPKLTFRFFIDETLCSEVMIVECGFHSK